MTQIQLPLNRDKNREILCIFDKDGTLIDFDAMWTSWIFELAERLDAAAGQPVAPAVFAGIGFDPTTRFIKPEGPFAVLPLADFYQLIVRIVREAGVSKAEQVVAMAWCTPDPVTSARPLCDLHALFGELAAQGIKLAIATSDNRALTEATLEALGIASFVSGLVCADDGLPIKPAPDMILSLCRELGVTPAHTVMVGDAVADVQMGRAAGAGLVVGVLSGVSDQPLLAPYADVVLPSIAALVS